MNTYLRALTSPLMRMLYLVWKSVSSFFFASNCSVSLAITYCQKRIGSLYVKGMYRSTMTHTMRVSLDKNPARPCAVIETAPRRYTLPLRDADIPFKEDGLTQDNNEWLIWTSNLHPGFSVEDDQLSVRCTPDPTYGQQDGTRTRNVPRSFTNQDTNGTNKFIAALLFITRLCVLHSPERSHVQASSQTLLWADISDPETDRGDNFKLEGSLALCRNTCSSPSLFRKTAGSTSPTVRSTKTPPINRKHLRSAESGLMAFSTRTCSPRSMSSSPIFVQIFPTSWRKAVKC
eukprot:1187453-Prorocentrum_minimum.AAC.1